MSTQFGNPSLERTALVTTPAWFPGSLDGLDWFTRVQYRLLRRIAPAARYGEVPGAEVSKLGVLLGTDFVAKLAGKTVLDFGCGEGLDAVELARLGARRVVGLDIREDVLHTARARATRLSVRNICHFTTSWVEPVDVIVSVDAFEHFEDPAGVLRRMAELLKPGGQVLIHFGPTWYHPVGGHLFSVFPWAHLLFTEKALIRWRADVRQDGATRFSEVAGGLNQMSIRRFVNLVEESPLRFERIQLIPIRKLRRLQNRFTREFTTAAVRCRLVRR